MDCCLDVRVKPAHVAGRADLQEDHLTCLLAAQSGARIVLGDRLVSVTLARTWAALSAWQKVRFVTELLITGISVPSNEIEKLLSSMEVRHPLIFCLKVFFTNIVSTFNNGCVGVTENENVRRHYAGYACSWCVYGQSGSKYCWTAACTNFQKSPVMFSSICNFV